MTKHYKSMPRLFVLVPIGVLLFGLNSKSQDLINSSVFTYKRPVGSSRTTTNKTVYRVRKQLPTRSHSGEIGKKRPTPTSPLQQERVRGPSKNSRSIEQLGITLWRLRVERPSDAGARLLTREGSSKMVAERVGLDTVFQAGDKVRMSVESPRAGFLYIIDRELRIDDMAGEPFMIFPTLKTRGGDNSVTAGRVIEVPAQTDDPFYFEISPTGADYVGELLTIIVSPIKIDGLELKDDPLKLMPALVENWEDLWERKSTSFELDPGRQVIYTEEEKDAGLGTRLLTQKSPAPQTLITVDAPQGSAFLVSFSMKVSH